MASDTAFIDMTKVDVVVSGTDGSLSLKIVPFVYLDKRNPRLPRKHSKQTDLQKDTNHIFRYCFANLNSKIDKLSRYSVDIKVYKGQDRLGKGDLDNYCKAILDGITATKKVWVDDRQVDELSIKRYFPTDKNSYIELKIVAL